MDGYKSFVDWPDGAQSPEAKKNLLVLVEENPRCQEIALGKHYVEINNDQIGVLQHGYDVKHDVTIGVS